MNNILSQKVFWKDIEDYLLRKKKQIDDEIESLEKDDPLLVEAVAESSELGTDSWQADVHSKVLAVSGRLSMMSLKIQESLRRIKEGTYGRCEKCGNEINKERLLAMPVATICQLCISS